MSLKSRPIWQDEMEKVFFAARVSDTRRLFIYIYNM